MGKFIIEATKSSPYICLDPQRHTLEIKGESYPENSAAFYRPLFTAVEEHLRDLGHEVFEINLQIVYFNSSSSKIFMNLFDMLDAAAGEGRRIVINWRFHPENDTALECGEEFKDEIRSLTFNLVTLGSE